jgi:urease accessory protein
MTAQQTLVPPLRQWQARLHLGLQRRDGKTVLVDNEHFGPLRVQRPFYPEQHDCCHIYLLHPPGGMVVGDLLEISVKQGPGTRALVTTPSAGKIYGVQGAHTVQRQLVDLQVDDRACVEWLPQENIAFNGANGRLATRLQLNGTAKACIWDIVCLGRPAAGEVFAQGRCDQTLEVWRDQRLLLLERNRFIGGEALLDASWGLKGCHTSGTMIMTVEPDRETVDDLLEHLNALMPERGPHHWGLTQKGELFIARYIGQSSLCARRGLQFLWQSLRPMLDDKLDGIRPSVDGKPREVMTPRIWNT